MSYSIDFRQHVLEFKDKHNLSFEETSCHFEISIRSLFRWSKNPNPCLKRNKPATKIDMDALREDVAKYPDDYQRERAVRLGVSQSCIFYALKRLNISCKKNAKSSKS